MVACYGEVWHYDKRTLKPTTKSIMNCDVMDYGKYQSRDDFLEALRIDESHVVTHVWLCDEHATQFGLKW